MTPRAGNECRGRGRAARVIAGVGTLCLVAACGGGGTESLSPTAPSTTGFTLVLESVGPGVTSTPSQNTSYAPGTTVSYGFTARDGTSSVYVLMDGAPVPASGSVTMNQSHVFLAAIDTDPGNRAPDLSGVSWDGQNVRLSQYRGRVVFVDFSAITCEGSINEAPFLQSLYTRYHGRGLDIVTVLEDCPALHDCPADRVATPEQLRDWQRAYQLPFPVVSDPGNATRIFNFSLRERASTFPMGYLIDGSGTIRQRFAGFSPSAIGAAVAALFP